MQELHWEQFVKARPSTDRVLFVISQVVYKVFGFSFKVCLAVFPSFCTSLMNRVGFSAHGSGGAEPCWA